MVYSLLHEHELGDYYRFDDQLGHTITSTIERPQFDILEDPEVQAKLISFSQDSIATTTLFIPSIHCTSCVWLLEHLHRMDEGIIEGRVNFVKRTLRIRFNQRKTTLRAIAELLTTVGYEPEIRLEQLFVTSGITDDNESSSGLIKNPSQQKKLWLKLGVAGFAFGNVMLFSFPEYLDLNQSSGDYWMAWVFGGLNILLSTPVLLYSAMDYLKSAWAALAQGGINLDVPISIGIVALFSRSLYEILSGTGAGYFDSFTGFIFFLLIGKLIQQKTFDHLSFDRDYRSYLPLSILRLSESGSEEVTKVTDLEIGDRVRIRNQELIPVDAVLESEQARIDYHFITGESETVHINRGANIYAGGKIIGNHIEALVSKTVEHSYLTELWNHQSMKISTKGNQISGFADRISPYFTFTVLGIAVLAFLYWWINDPSLAFTVFTAVLIVACPCALALSTPFTLSSALNVLSLNGLYIRNSSLIEAFAQVKSFVFDKTGTLTSTQRTQTQFVGVELSQEQKEWIHSVVSQSLHPLSKKIHSHLQDAKIKATEDLEEIPGKGISGRVKGMSVVLGNPDFVSGHILKNHEINSESLTNEWIATQVHVAIDGEYLGYFEFGQGLRAGIGKTLQQLMSFGDVYLLSGDTNREEKYFRPLCDWKQLVFKQSPVEKLEFIEQLDQNGQSPCMIGDGLNDAGALKIARFGIAISDDMSAFTPACDAIIEGNALVKLAQLKHFSHDAMRVILLSFGISLIYNVVGLGFAISGHLSPLVAAIIMPASSISVMVFTFFSTRILAQKRGLRIWV
jgi:Cu+-exporting ATPase